MSSFWTMVRRSLRAHRPRYRIIPSSWKPIWGARKMPMLVLENIVAGYIPGVEILRGVNLHVEKGEIVCLVGPNGAGKSTVLRTISGFLRPTTGKVIFNDQPIDGLPPEQMLRRGITHVPQGHSVFPKMTVHENLLMGAYTLKDRARSEEHTSELQS